MKKSILTAILAGISVSAFTQSDIDALRFSQTTFGGTARGMGAGGAFGALGGDMTSLTINPAGIAQYRTSEFIITPALHNTWTTSDFLGNSNKEFRYNFNFSSIGLVGTEVNSDDAAWKSVSFGFGYNRVANFHRKTFFHGYNPDNSLTDRYVEIANSLGIHSSEISDSRPFDAGLAYEVYLINPLITDSTRYSSAIPDGETDQLQTRTTRGKIDEWYIAAGGNYNGKLYMGASLGIPALAYKDQLVYEEIDSNDSIPDFNSFSVSNTLTTQGIGVNLKLGLIYRVNDYVRIGGAVHSPSYYWMSDKYSASMNSDFDSIVTSEWISPNGEFDYQLLTPFRLVGSAAFLLKDHGFLSVDYEWLDYSQALFDFKARQAADEVAESGINQAIIDKYSPASNIRIGGEGTLGIYRIRAGYAVYGTPFKAGVETGSADFSRRAVSFGLGMREKDYFIDIAYIRTTSTEFDSPYDLAGEETPGSTNSVVQNNAMLTFGLKF